MIYPRLKISRRRLPQGFTLIELLVVIAIITLLMALLLPVLEKTREIGKRIKCLSGARQVAIAARQYALDSKEYVPTNGVDGYPSVTGASGSGFQANLVDKSDDPSTPGANSIGGGYTQRDNFTSRGGCPYGPDSFSVSESGGGGEYYGDPISPSTSYGMPGQLQTGAGWTNPGGPGSTTGTDYGPYRFSEKRLSKYSSMVALITCCHIACEGGAPLAPGHVASPSGAGWFSEEHAGNPQEGSAFPVLWKTLGLSTIAGWTPSPPIGQRHKGDGLPMAFADTHGEFVTKSEITSRSPLTLFTGGPNSTVWWNPTNAQDVDMKSTFKMENYRRMLYTYSYKFMYAGVDN